MTATHRFRPSPLPRPPRARGWTPAGRRLVAGLSASLAFATIADAAVSGPELLWADRPDASGFVAVDIRGPHMATLAAPEAGAEANVAAGNRVRLYRSVNGDLLWEGAAPDPGESIDAMATEGRGVGGTIYLFGTAAATEDDPANALRFRALSSDDGSVRWSSLYVFLGGGRVSLSDATRFGPRLFASGGLGDGIFVKVVDTRSGAPLWDDLPANDSETFAAQVSRVLFRNKRLYVAGTRDRFPLGRFSPLFVRRYHAHRGRLQWEAEFGTGINRVNGLAAEPLTLAVAGDSYDLGTGATRWVVYGLDIFDGDVAWSDRPWPAAFSSATAIAAGDARIYAVGWVSRARTLPVVRAYDRIDGTLLWERVGADVIQGRYRAVVRNSRAGLIVAGEGTPPGEDTPRTLLQAFDPADGTLLWSRFGAAGVDGGSFETLFSRNNDLLVGGTLRRDSGATEALLQLFELPPLADPAGAVRLRNPGETDS